MRLKVGTTFSGIGAPEVALKQCGIDHDILWSCEIDEPARKTYQANHQCRNIYYDITTLNIKDLEPVDLYVFGFPCTDISNMGKQDLSRGKSMLVNYSLNIIDHLLPDYILFENVKTLLSDKFKEFYSYIHDRLAINYNLHVKVMNSSDFGLPQNRERVFGLGIKKDISKTFKFPEPRNVKISLKDVLEGDVSDFYLNSDKWYAYYNYHWEKERGFVKINPTIGRCLTTRDFYNYRGTFISPNNISNDIKRGWEGTVAQNTFEKSDKIRRLTERECARLHGFPEDFVIPVNDKEAYKQFGNTISINVLEDIFRNLFLNT